MNIRFTSPRIYIAGVPGFFEQTNKCGGFCHVHHVILSADNDCIKRAFVGSIPKGCFGSPGITPRGNGQFGAMVVGRIRKYIETIN